MSPFNLEDYEPVDERLGRFWDKHPEGRVFTEIVQSTDKQWVVVAGVYRSAEDSHPAATGYAQETIGQGNVNRTSALENCETSAIGRALANLGFAAKGKRPSREEMVKAGSTPSLTEREQGTKDGGHPTSASVSPPTTLAPEAQETTLLPKAVSPQALVERYGWGEVKPVARLVAMDKRAFVPVTQEQFLSKQFPHELVVEVAARLGYNQETLQGTPS